MADKDDKAPVPFTPAQAREMAVAQEAFRMRAEGRDYHQIAKALDLKKGWTEAYKLVARGYGQAAADQDKERMRNQEVGRLMYMRALLEDRIKMGDEKAMEMDLKYTTLIIETAGLKDGVVSGSAGGKDGGGVQVINVIPPWEKNPPNADGPAADLVIDGEAADAAVDEGAEG